MTGMIVVEGTTKFVLMFDKLFDAVNVSNFINGTHYHKDFQHPYRHKVDN